MQGYVGVTDWDWYTFLRDRGIAEVNFWQPSGGRRFAAVPAGSPFFFKSHYSHGNRIVGAGFLSGWASLTMSRAWEFFGESNGCASLQEMRRRVMKYRGVSARGERDPEVGCIMLRDVRFFAPEDAAEAPPGWSANIVQGRSYDFASEGGSHLEHVLRSLIAGLPDGGEPGLVPGGVFGAPVSRPARVGQAAFKALVQEAYSRKCAVTGDRIVPVLQAAHIRPVTSEGQNRVDNGLLLRSDVHTLFDLGYLGIHPDRKSLLVSPRLRRDWSNGKEFYDRAGSPIAQPTRVADRPNRDFLTWHSDTVYLAS